MPISADIPGCNYNECRVKNNQYLTGTVTARMPSDAKGLKIRAKANWFFFSYDLPLSNWDSNACNHSSPKCPLKKGQIVTFKIKSGLYAPFSNIKPTVTLTMSNERGQDIMCAKTEIHLV